MNLLRHDIGDKPKGHCSNGCSRCLGLIAVLGSDTTGIHNENDMGKSDENVHLGCPTRLRKDRPSPKNKQMSFVISRELSILGA